MSTISMDSRSNYRVFISFNNADRALAEHLAKGLRRTLDDFDAVYCYSLPGRLNSKGGSRPADDFHKGLDDKLKWCNVFILLWSVRAKNEGWVKYEFSQAKHFYVNQVRRQGKAFKIIPIRIDKCGLPIGLHNIVRIDYSSGEGFQNVFNQVLSALGFLPESDDIAVSVVRDAVFDITTAFRNGEWAIVAQQYPTLTSLYPMAISARTHYMYAIALMHQGQEIPSQRVVREALGLAHSNRDAELLYDYIQILQRKKFWSEAQIVTEKAMVLFPDDARWPQIRLDVYRNSTTPSTASFLSSQNVPPNQPFHHVSQVSSNDATHILADASTLLLSSTQPSSFIPSSSTASQTQDFSSLQNFKGVSEPMTEALGLSSNNMSSNMTEDFVMDEELQSADIAGEYSSTRNFVTHHFSHHQLKRLLSVWLVFVALLTSLCFLFISLAWPLNTNFMGLEAIVILPFLGVGRMVDMIEMKLFCLSVFCVLWGLSGYCLGNWFLSFLGGQGVPSVKNWIELVSIVIGLVLGLVIHIKLFYHNK